MKKTLIWMGFFLAFGQAWAQFEFYKLQDGKQELISAGETLSIPIDEKGAPAFNVMVKLNFADYKEKLSYDKLIFVLEKESRVKNGVVDQHSKQVWLALHREHIQKRFEKQENAFVFLFNTEEVKAKPNDWALLSPTFDGVMNEGVNYRFVVAGEYVTEVSKEYNNTDGWQEKYDYGRAEIITQAESPHIQWAFDEGFALQDKYEILFESDYVRHEEGFTRHGLKKRLQTESRRSDSPLTKALSNSLLVVADYFDRELLAEKDKNKAIQLLNAFNDDMKYLRVNTLPMGKQRSLGQALKKAKTPQEKISIFRKMNPNPEKWD